MNEIRETDEYQRWFEELQDRTARFRSSVYRTGPVTGSIFRSAETP
jgi:hypothetical protein